MGSFLRLKLWASLAILFSSGLRAQGHQFLPISQARWGNYDVTWIEDDRYPTYQFSLYFADGASSDRLPGETEYAFNLLDTGTNRFTQKEIQDALEFYGVSYSAAVTHEYILFNVSGLVKDIVPTMKMVCHLFSDAIYPKQELDKVKVREKSALTNLSSSHGDLVDRIFRELSLKGTPYTGPTSGTLSSIGKITPRMLSDKLDYYKNKVKKKIYLSGPKDLAKVKNVFLEDCGMNPNANFVRGNPQKAAKAVVAKKSPQIYFVPVANANQAQIRIGRFMPMDEVKEHDLATVAAGFLGGGFTSKLMSEARGKRGLTYGIGSMVSFQHYYGREFIRTSTKNQSVKEMLELVRDILGTTGAGNIENKEWEGIIGQMSGSYLFKFEDNGAYLSNLVYFDHIGRKASELYQFPQTIRTFNPPMVARKIKEIYDWNKQVIVVLGAPSVKKELKGLGPVQEVNYKNFL